MLAEERFYLMTLDHSILIDNTNTFTTASTFVYFDYNPEKNDI